MFDNRPLLEWVTVLAGAWVALSTWVAPAMDPGAVLSGAAQANHLIIGIAVVALGLAGVFAFRFWEEWVLALLGLWLLASPWLFGFTHVGPFVISDIVAGLLVVAMSGWVAFTDDAAA